MSHADDVSYHARPFPATRGEAFHECPPISAGAVLNGDRTSLTNDESGRNHVTSHRNARLLSGGQPPGRFHRDGPRDVAKPLL